MPRIIHWLIATACTLAVSAAAATDRYFPDQHITSPRNVVRLDATSPDNAGVQPEPFARNFTYTLTRVSDGKELWSRKQGEDEASPMQAFVHDEGWVVVWNSFEQLMVLNKGDGNVVACKSILDQFPEAETKKFVRWTTGGPMWSAASTWRFATLQARTMFVVTTGWGRHVTMDVASGKYIRLTPEAERELHVSDLAIARETVKAAVDNIDSLCDSGVDNLNSPKTPVSASQLSSALATLLRAEVKGMTPTLRQLEQCDYIGSSGGRWDLFGKYADGINPFMYHEFTLRRIAQLGLRRVGEKPVELPGFQIFNAEHIGVNLPAPRAQRVDLVKQGMNTRELLEAIGHPDLVQSHRGTWEYDVDDQEPFTLVIHFDEQAVSVERIERLPPAWKEQHRWNDVFGLN